jgi:hypothetical protein
MMIATRVFLLAALLGVPAALSAQNVPEVTPRDAATHIGQMAKICGHVQAASYMEDQDQSPTVMRVGGTYPYERINVIVYGANRGKFSPVPEEAYRGKDICVTGTIDFYDGSAMIVADAPDKIQVKQP